MWHDPFAGDLWLKDRIARELLEESDFGGGEADGDSDRPAGADPGEAATEPLRERPSFLMDDAATDVDILTGEARED